MKNIKKFNCIAVSLLSLGLSACGGDAPDSSTNAATPSPVATAVPTLPPTPTPQPTPVPTSPPTSVLTGVLVVPEQIKASGARILQNAGAKLAKGSSACPDVPDGYIPVINAKVEFLDKNGAVQGPSATTDQCGNFSATVATTVTQVKANSAGNKEIVIAANNLLPSNSGTKPVLLSFLPSNANFKIASLQLSNGKLAFTVVDDVSNKAVLGLGAGNFVLSVNDQAQAVKSLAYAATQTGSDASVGLVLDASGSMTSPAFDKAGKMAFDVNNNLLTGFRMAALASHAFLEAKSNNDEVAFTIFDSKINFIDDSWFAANSFNDVAGVKQTYSFSADGFSKDSSKLHLIADVYNQASKLYSAKNVDDLYLAAHKGYSAKFFYPWSGGTAIYSAADTALSKLIPRVNSRKMLIVMTDGDDNQSTITVDNLIKNAKTAGIPIWTVAFGSGLNSTSLEKIAKDTNGNFVSSIDQSALAAQFKAIQTGIVYQYLLASDSDIKLASKSTLKLQLNYNGQVIERSLIIQ